jgi:hypothetical protein
MVNAGLINLPNLNAEYKIIMNAYQQYLTTFLQSDPRPYRLHKPAHSLLAKDFLLCRSSTESYFTCLDAHNLLQGPA